MAMTKQIKIIMAEMGVNQGELARMIGMTDSKLSRRLEKDDWCESDLQKIATALGYDYISGSFKNKHTSI